MDFLGSILSGLVLIIVGMGILALILMIVANPGWVLVIGGIVLGGGIIVKTLMERFVPRDSQWKD